MSKLVAKAYHPVNDSIEDIWEGFSWPCLFLDFLWFIYKGMWGWGVIALILAFCTFGISWLIFPFYANGLYAKSLLQQGYLNEEQRNERGRATTGTSNPNLHNQQGGVRNCPFCAETIKAEAHVCRYCNRDVTPLPPQTQNKKPESLPQAVPKKPKPRNFSLSYAVIAGVFILGMFALSGKSNESKKDETLKSNSSQQGEARSTKTTVHTWSDSVRSAPAFADTLDAVIRIYGPPDEDDSTQYDNPRPPLVTRWIVYKTGKVRLTFTPDAHIGTPPPYKKWKTSFFQDSQSNAFLLAEEAKTRLAHRATSQ